MYSFGILLEANRTLSRTQLATTKRIPLLPDEIDRFFFDDETKT